MSSNPSDKASTIPSGLRYRFCLAMKFEKNRPPLFVCALGRLDVGSNIGQWHSVGRAYFDHKRRTDDPVPRDSPAVFAPFLILKVAGQDLSQIELEITKPSTDRNPSVSSCITQIGSTIESVLFAEDGTIRDGSKKTWYSAVNVFGVDEQEAIRRDSSVWPGLCHRLFRESQGKRRGFVLRRQDFCRPTDVFICDAGKIPGIEEKAIAPYLAKVARENAEALRQFTIDADSMLLDCFLSLGNWSDVSYVPAEHDRTALVALLPHATLVKHLQHESATPSAVTGPTLAPSPLPQRLPDCPRRWQRPVAIGIGGCVVLACALLVTRTISTSRQPDAQNSLTSGFHQSFATSSPAPLVTTTPAQHEPSVTDLIPVFPEGVFGVLVGPFSAQGTDDTEAGARLQNETAALLKARAWELGIHTVDVRPLPDTPQALHLDAKDIRNKLLSDSNARILIWGDIVGNRVLAYLHLGHDSHLPGTEGDWATVSLCPLHAVKILDTSAKRDLRMNALTDLPTAVLAAAAATQAEDHEDLEEAIAHYRSIVRIFPNEFWNSFQIGLLSYKIRDYSNALAAFNQTIQIAPTNALGYMGRAMCYWSRTNTALSWPDINKAESLEPHSTAMFRLGVYMIDHDYSNAIRVLDKDLSDKSYEFHMRHLYKAYVYIQMTNSADAQAEIDIASAVPLPSEVQPSFLAFRSTLYRASGDTTNALRDISRCIEIGKATPDNYFQRAQLYLDTQQRENALQDLRHVRAMKQCRPSEMFRVAMKFHSLDMWEEASDAYQRYLEIAPEWQKDDIRRAQESLQPLSQLIKNAELIRQLRDQQDLSKDTTPPTH